MKNTQYTLENIHVDANNESQITNEMVNNFEQELMSILG